MVLSASPYRKQLLVLDTNVVLHQMDLLETDGCLALDDVIIPQTVMEEVRHPRLLLLVVVVPSLTLFAQNKPHSSPGEAPQLGSVQTTACTVEGRPAAVGGLCQRAPQGDVCTQQGRREPQ